MPGVLEYIMFAGASLSFLMAIGQLVVRPRGLRNYLFAFFFLNLAGIQIHGFLFGLGYKMWPFDIPLIFATGPCLVFLYREITREDYRISLQELGHLLPVVAAVVLVGFADFVEFLFVFAMCLTFVHVIGIGRATTFIWTLDLKPDERPVQLIMVSAITVAVGVLVFLLFWFDLALLRFVIYPLLFSGIMFYSLIVGHRYPELYQLTTRSKGGKEYKKSSLAGMDPKELAKKLELAFTQDRIYEDDELTLRGLARHIHLTPHQVSEYINLHMGSNFASVVNSYRVEAAKGLLIDQPHQEVLTIAYQVGFGSKTSFNRAFTNFAGISPTEFRQTKIKSD